MLRLLYAIACENAIIADNGVTSLVSILERVEATLPVSAPEKIIIPMKWYFVCLWTRDETNYAEATPFEQEVAVTTKEGDEFIKISQPFTVSNNHTNYRNVTEFPAFPVSPGGRVTIKVRSRKGKGKWSDPVEYTITTSRKLLEANQ